VEHDEPAVTIIEPFDDEPMLHVLASVAQTTPGFSIGVTLNVAGGVVSGELIGMSHWFEEFQEAHPPVKAILGGFAKAFEEARGDPEEAEYHFLHLRKAAIYTAGQEPLGNGGLFWRGRISQVAGWSFGTFRPDAWDE
jgi:hypothetical protein